MTHIVSRVIGCVAFLAATQLAAQGSLGAIAGTTVANGMLVNVVPAGSAAAQAGVHHGDILSAFDGKRVTSVEALQTFLQQSRAGAVVKLVVNRGGKEYQTSATLEAPTAVSNDADALRQRMNERDRDMADLRKQLEAAKPPKAETAPFTPVRANAAPAPDVPVAENGRGIPAGLYRCRATGVNGYNVVLTIRFKDASNYAVIGDTNERPGQYRFDPKPGAVAGTGTVNWLSGPLKANTVDNNRAADYEQDNGGVLTVFRGYTANRCRLSN
jgi:hypothetical protein